MRKEYTIKELTEILGCSRTAIVKKIVTDDNTGVRRYKNRYNVVSYNGQMAIIFEDFELEQEKKLSRGMGSVNNNGYNTSKNEDVIDVDPIVNESNKNELYEFTERYMQQFVTFQETTNATILNLERQKLAMENQIKLIEDHKLQEKAEQTKTIEENKKLKKSNRVLAVLLGVAVIVLVVFATYIITTNTLANNEVNTLENVSESVKQEVIQHPENFAQKKNGPYKK